MHYVYILKSINYNQIYIGQTRDLKNRLKTHNTGGSKHTSKYKPWKVVWYSAFENKHIAQEFEKYLKTGSGKAFIHKRLMRK